MHLFLQRLIFFIHLGQELNAQAFFPENKIARCGVDVANRLNQDFSSLEGKKFCGWATSKQGGGATPGISWGKIKDTVSRKRFADAGCSLVEKGIAPTCSKLQGDEFLMNWRYYIFF